MKVVDGHPPVVAGGFADAERLRRWSFARRTPEQRLAWLVEMLSLAYGAGAIKPRHSGSRDKPPP